jgi:hypothetical protein
VNENVPLGVPKFCKSEDKRFTIMRVGNSRGFLPGCDLFLSSEVEHRDNHKNMNAKIFKMGQGSVAPSTKQRSIYIYNLFQNQKSTNTAFYLENTTDNVANFCF